MHYYFLSRDAMQSAVMPQYVICLSLMFRYRDHIGWNTKIISRPNSEGTCSHWLQHRRSSPMGTPTKLWRNRAGVISTKISNISKTVHVRTKVTMVD